MFKPVSVKPLADYRIWIKFQDGAEGEVDLSSLVGKGVFKAWEDYDRFQQVAIAKTGELTWGDDLDICSDSIYLQLTKQKPEDIFSIKE